MVTLDQYINLRHQSNANNTYPIPWGIDLTVQLAIDERAAEQQAKAKQECQKAKAKAEWERQEAKAKAKWECQEAKAKATKEEERHQMKAKKKEEHDKRKAAAKVKKEEKRQKKAAKSEQKRLQKAKVRKKQWWRNLLGKNERPMVEKWRKIPRKLIPNQICPFKPI